MAEMREELDRALRRNDLARVIWETSRADEGTISATGANHVADALLPMLAEAWDEGHASAHGYDLTYHLDRKEWSEEYAAANPYRSSHESGD